MKKQNMGLIIAIVVLCLLVVGLGGYIIYDKISGSSNISDNNVNENDDANSNQNTNKEYNVGDEITFHNEKWNVIKEYDDYVVALKSTALDELNGKPYYECPPEDDNGINCSMKMSNDYKDSVAKKYFEETYIKQLGEENLKEVNNYSIRLITIEELRELGCDANTCDNAPSWLLSNSMSWTMSSANETTTNAIKANVYAFGSDKKLSSLEILGVGSTMNVRPVINLLKSSIK